MRASRQTYTLCLTSIIGPALAVRVCTSAARDHGDGDLLHNNVTASRGQPRDHGPTAASRQVFAVRQTWVPPGPCETTMVSDPTANSDRADAPSLLLGATVRRQRPRRYPPTVVDDAPPDWEWEDWAARFWASEPRVLTDD